ncbi:MAG TPA: ABC transporter permease [Candidatus Dormibacteraeota bacterium]|nr:ABC transporter permease [Candidatus Dormibacteraeota bacterium]
MIDWAWIAGHLDVLAYRTLQHLYLTAIAVAVGFAISFGLAVLAVRRRPAYGPIVGVTGLLYTIPSLALFPFFIPITGLSDFTAEIPLVLYSLLIFIRNIVAGLDGVPRDILEAADGAGYGPRTRFWRIEVPLAIPLIVAGIRLAAVSTIGLVTITGILGDRFGGLGFFIFEGRRHSFATEIFLGGLVTIVLAVAVDTALVRIQRRLTPWARAAIR